MIWFRGLGDKTLCRLVKDYLTFAQISAYVIGKSGSGTNELYRRKRKKSSEGY